MDWYLDFHGYVTSALAWALSQRMEANPGMTFREAYAAMLGRRAVITVHDDGLPCRVCELLHSPLPDVDAGSPDNDDHGAENG